MPRSDVRSGGVTRIVWVLLVVWLLIGLLAAGQRHYFSGSTQNCAKAGTIAVTVVAGPLNYIGVNPKVASCHVPQPSK
jgi:membrane protein YdbS with pleckstrin-like domain